MNDHFLELNLLTLGEIIDSNRLPTLLLVEPVSTKVSTFPVKPFSRPILKSTQLSFFIVFFSNLSWFDVVRRGDSQLWFSLLLGFISSGTMSTSYSSSIVSEK